MLVSALDDLFSMLGESKIEKGFWSDWLCYKYLFITLRSDSSLFMLRKSMHIFVEYYM